MGFLIDTCAWIDVEQGTLAPADVATLTREEPVFLSPVTIAELRFGAEVATRSWYAAETAGRATATSTQAALAARWNYRRYIRFPRRGD